VSATGGPGHQIDIHASERGRVCCGVGARPSVQKVCTRETREDFIAAQPEYLIITDGSRCAYRFHW
jgi:hypothetical protein